MAQYRKDKHEYLADGKTIFETVMLADIYGNAVGAANPSGMAVDAFGRARVSQPLTLFDSFHRYQDNGKITTSNSATGATVSHNTNAGLIECTLDTTSGSFIKRESSRVFAYQPGKALRNEEPVLTPTGWKPIESLSVDDLVFDGLGNITKVTGVFPQGKRKIYRFTFDDETTIDADEEHLWVTVIRTDKSRHGKSGDKRILTTKQMLEEQGNVPKVQNRWKIPCSPVLKIEEKPVNIDPYTLGLVLGDGHITERGYVTYTTADEEILDYIICEQITKRSKSIAYGLLGIDKHLCNYGLSGKTSHDKFIPNEYKFNSENVRLNVLRGLMDTDGWIEKDKCTYYSTASKQLAEDVSFLVRSLGGTAKIKYKDKTFYTKPNGVRVECSPAYKVVVIIPVNPFRLSRKANKWRLKYRTSFDRYIYSIKEIGEYDATCIRVESEDKTFITKNHIVTHNSLQILETFVLSPAKANLRQRYGYFSTQNGIFLEVDGTTVQFVERSYSTGSVVETKITQANWNVDKLDGTGPSRLTLDLTKAQIMFIDIEWLGLGSVRCGFVINGNFIHCHSFHHANFITSTYMTTACLPVRAEIENTGTTASNSTLKVVCASVLSEGGYELRGKPRTIGNGINSLVTLTTANTYYPLQSIRLKSTHLDGVVIPKNISILGTSNTTRYKYAIISGATIAGAVWTSIGTDSCVEYNSNSSATMSGGTELFSGFFTVSNQSAPDIALDSGTFKYQLERNSFTNTAFSFTLAIMGASNSDTALGSIDWEEVT